MQNRRNYYRILHVQPDAPDEMIAAGYRTLMQRLRRHPDLGGDHWNAALINEAFAVLRDPDTRRAYDATLRQSADRRQAEAAPAPAAALLAGPAGPQSMHCAFCDTLHSTNAGRRPDARCALCRSPLFAVSRDPDPRESATDRAVERIERRIPVGVYVTWPQAAPIRAVSEDISIHGMRLVAATEFAIGECLKVECDFCDAVGVVAHVSGEGLRPGTWHAGVKFVTFCVRQVKGGLVSVSG